MRATSGARMLRAGAAGPRVLSSLIARGCADSKPVLTRGLLSGNVGGVVRGWPTQTGGLASLSPVRARAAARMCVLAAHLGAEGSGERPDMGWGGAGRVEGMCTGWGAGWGPCLCRRIGRAVQDVPHWERCTRGLSTHARAPDQPARTGSLIPHRDLPTPP